MNETEGVVIVLVVLIICVYKGFRLWINSGR